MWFQIFAALTQFEGMCGFRPVAEVQDFLRAVPEFSAVIGHEASSIVMSCSGTANEEKAILFVCV